MNTVIYTAIIIILTIIMCFIIYLIFLSLNKDTENLPKIISIIPISGSCSNIEYAVRKLLWAKKWNNNFGDNIVIITDNLDNETNMLCEKLCKEFPAVHIAAAESKIKSII